MPQTGQMNILPISARLATLEARPQPVVAHRRDLAAGEVLPTHSHRRGQLVYASSGVMTVVTPEAACVVPPARAVWMPGGVEHRIEARTALAMRTVYVEPEAVPRLPSSVCVLQVSPLLRELIVAAVERSTDYAPDSREARLAAVLLDEIAAQPQASLALPMPTEPRLARITRALLANPGDARSLAEWGREVGASVRTLSRLFRAETGLGFLAWRQQRRLHRALELLGADMPVTTVGAELGYDSTSAFIAMFRRAFGVTPAKYLSAAQASQSAN